MKFKVVLLLFFFAFFIIGDSAKISGRGRVSSGGGSRRGGYSRTSSSGSYSASSGTSYGSVSHGTSHGTPHGGTSRGGISPGTSYGGISHGTSHGTPHVGTSSSVAHSSGKITPQQNKDFLTAEGGGATRPVETKPSQPSHGNLYPPSPSSGYGHVPNMKPGLVTESRQTSSIQPSAPQDHVMKSAGTLQTQGHPTSAANPPWSNPYLHDNKPSISGQIHPSSNYNPGVNKPTIPAAQPPPIGFKDHVYPQSSPTSGNSQVGHPPYPIGHPPYPTGGHSSYLSGHPPYPNGHPPYPSAHPPYPSAHPSYPSAHPPYSGGSAPYPYPSHSSGTFQTPPSSSFPIHPSNSVPMANPYSMHSPGQTYYPQQPHVFAQPASQPFVPGQTILMMPGQQDSGRGFGQMVKEALVFSTINAGVNRLINPHTHNYVESRPDTGSPATTHVTYNNQYFNTPPGVNGATNPINVPPESVPNSNPYPSGTFTPNVGASNGPSGIINPNVGASNSPSGTINPNVGTNNGPTLGNVNTYIPNIANSGVGGPSSSGTNSGVGGIVNNTATGSNTSHDQTNSFGNSNGVDNTFFYRISDKELYHITEELFAKNSLNISKYIKLNLQNRVSSSNSSNITDQAFERLFYVEPELLEHPTIYLTRSLYDSYQHDYLKKLNRTIETRKQENLLIDTFLNTNVMSTAMDWLADYGFIDPDDFERKDVLRRIWFTMFSGSTCGFERVFASENYGTAIIGAQDWLYFENQESLGRIDYMGYLDKLDLGNTSSLLKLNFQMDGIIRPNATIFVGTLPELEMSLYTICFYARSNNICPVSLGGTKFNIYTHSFMYFGNEVIDLGLPMF